ncbi:MAG: hypothetical protein QXO00_04110 [Candidatus Bathyarchaeia archaeon]
MSFILKWFKGTKTHQNAPESTEKHQYAPIDNGKAKDSTITLSSANVVSEFPLRVFVILGKQGYGKTTLVNNIASYYLRHNIRVVRVAKLEDLEQQNAVLVIDDLKTDLTRKVMAYMVEKFRTVRHQKQIIILTHHILNDVPSDLLRLSDKVIFFNTAFSVNSPTSKIHEIISKNKREHLHELVLSLEPYHYIIVKANKVYGAFLNTNIEPIVSDSYGKEIALISNGENNKDDVFKPSEDLLKLVVEKIPEFHYLTLTMKVVKLVEMFPDLKPKAIAKIVGAEANSVRARLSYARQKGLLP